MPLQSDTGELDIVPTIQAVYVPSCPYNLVPPHVLIRQMKQQGFDVDYFKHDDKNYIFKYRQTSSALNPHKWRNITIPIGSNDMFTLRTNAGFKHFMSRAASYLSEFSSFAGSANIIEDNDSVPNEPPISKKLRELDLCHSCTDTHDGHEKMREVLAAPNPIPHLDSDFAPLKSIPVSEEFQTTTPPPIEVASVAAYSNK